MGWQAGKRMVNVIRLIKKSIANPLQALFATSPDLHKLQIYQIHIAITIAIRLYWPAGLHNKCYSVLRSLSIIRAQQGIDRNLDTRAHGR
jgi:hypothetical protein